MCGLVLLRVVVFLTWTFALSGCGGPVIRGVPEHQPEALRGKRVLFVPLAISDELGDERTGVVLSNEARLVASEAACKRIAEEWSDGELVCLERARLAKSSSLSELQLLFARDRAIPLTLLRALRREYGTEFALLFRPESTASSQRVTQKRVLVSSPVAGLLPGGLGLAAMVASAESRKVTTNRTELKYTVSASLVSMNGKLLMVGVHSDSESHTVNRNLGYAEPPPIEPLLEGIMLELGEGMLEQ